MKYLKFEIENFKGIKRAEVQLGKTGAPSVFCLVGLNESGKTTVLEALHSFAPDTDAKAVVGMQQDLDEQRRQAVPRSRLADFTGKVSIKAFVELEDGDREGLADYLDLTFGLTVNSAEFPDQFFYERFSEYTEGDFKGSFYNSNAMPSVKTGKQRKWRSPDVHEQAQIAEALRNYMPSIAYFPSFVFEFPERIYLSNRPAGRKNQFYRRLFQDILDFGGRGHKISDHIVNRVRKTEFQVEWSGFIPTFRISNEKQQVDQVVDHAARTVTNVVYNKWNEIFGEDSGGKEIIIDWDVEAGRQWNNDTKSYYETNEHDTFVQFQVKDGPDRFSIGTRSLGFRWFFSFLLFTQFRAERNADRPVVFLLDEPASNLHSSAQQKLIESFPEIAGSKHVLVYSTHSHYMIEPNWLEQAYIIQNEPTLAGSDVMASATLDDASVDIRVTPYRQFIDQNPKSISYFQPIVDRLNVVPSKFDTDRKGIIVEGKSDYYILEYLKRECGLTLPRLYPALGAGTLSALVSLLKGWGVDIRILLDSDSAGKKEMDRYKSDYALTDAEIKLFTEFDSGVVEVEKLLSKNDIAALGALLGKSKATKKDILLLFQEYLAGSKKLPLEKSTIEKARALLKKLAKFQGG